MPLPLSLQWCNLVTSQCHSQSCHPSVSPCSVTSQYHLCPGDLLVSPCPLPLPVSPCSLSPPQCHLSIVTSQSVIPRCDLVHCHPQSCEPSGVIASCHLPVSSLMSPCHPPVSPVPCHPSVSSVHCHPKSCGLPGVISPLAPLSVICLFSPACCDPPGVTPSCHLLCHLFIVLYPSHLSLVTITCHLFPVTPPVHCPFVSPLCPHVPFWVALR